MRASILLALVCGALLVPLQASADSGFSSTRVNLRAGPGTDYPVLAVVPGYAQVNIHGCLDGYSWCDVNWGVTRGWVAARYLRLDRYGRSVYQRHGPPLTAFNFNNYWTSHYRDRPFYSHRDRWHRYHRATMGGASQTQARPGRQSAIGNSSTFGPARRPAPSCDPGTPGCPPRFR